MFCRQTSTIVKFRFSPVTVLLSTRLELSEESDKNLNDLFVYDASVVRSNCHN